MNNFEIISVKNFNDLNNLYELWNEEFRFIYPITSELWKRNISNINYDLSFVCLIDNKPVGFIMGKTWKDDYVISSYLNTAWISLIYVSTNYRKIGVGTSLLNHFEEGLKPYNINKIYIGRDYYNFFPGIPVDSAKLIPWFNERGFNVEGQTYDLIRYTRSPEHLPIENDEFTFRIAGKDDKDSLLDFIYRNWPGRWHKEAIDYFKSGTGEEYLICLNKKGEICGFLKISYPTTPTSCISYSLTWRSRFKALGGIGPLGIDPNYRKRHLGLDIVSSAVNILIDKGASDIIIDWTGLLEFYRHMGFEVWKSYFYTSKVLNKI